LSDARSIHITTAVDNAHNAAVSKPEKTAVWTK